MKKCVEQLFEVASHAAVCAGRKSLIKLIFTDQKNEQRRRRRKVKKSWPPLKPTRFIIYIFYDPDLETNAKNEFFVPYFIKPEYIKCASPSNSSSQWPAEEEGSLKCAVSTVGYTAIYIMCM